MLLYFAFVSVSTLSRFLEELRLRVRLSFRRIAEAEKDDSVSLGDTFSSGLLECEKLGARGPVGLAWLDCLLKSAGYLGCIYLANSPPFLGKEDEMNGDMLRRPVFGVPNEKGMLLLVSIAGAK